MVPSYRSRYNARADKPRIDANQPKVRTKPALAHFPGGGLRLPFLSMRGAVQPIETNRLRASARLKPRERAQALAIAAQLRPATRSSFIRRAGVPLFCGARAAMAAGMLASELRCDLFRVALSARVSKYIGETEKNLDRLFDAASHSDAILLLDEAEALFGKRSEVKDAHDRFANVEADYLLQRLERFRGIAVLAAALKQNIDPAFLRRLQVYEFPPRRRPDFA
jgi:hypothetical protein